MNTIHPIKAFSDNYIWCLHDEKHAMVVDPGEAEPVVNYLQKNKLELTSILITHHHYDHINGLPELEEKYSPKVYRPQDLRIPQSSRHTIATQDSDVKIERLGVGFRVLELPGHTSSHIAYFNDDLVFCGDTLFSLGCGRMFEGTPQQFFESLEKLKNLKPSTKVYCTHEYTMGNLKFHQNLIPDDVDLHLAAKQIESKLQNTGISLPTSIEFECKHNLFLRTSDHCVQKAIENRIQQKIENKVELFAKLRQLKDEF